MTPESEQIKINSKPVKGYQYLHIKQQINSHHFFEVGIDLENIESEGAHTIDKSKDWLGKTIVINTHEKDFTGIVSNIRLAHDNGHHGQLIISGYSSTIVLENGEHMQSWLKKPLKKIVKDVSKHSKITASIKPEYTSEITYETQYLETSFQFLKRLARQYNEWLYYDGDTLFFGKPSKGKVTELIYGIDATEMQIGIQTQARKYKSFSYNSFIDEKYTSKSPDNPSGLNELGQLAFNASLENYSEPVNIYSQMRIGNKAELDTHLKKKQQSAFASSNFISIKTTKRGLTVGDIIDLRSEVFKGKGSLSKKGHGEYIITEIEHYAAVGNQYNNTIIALPADIKTLPEPVVGFPVGETQMATVVDNQDPEKKGRVQVKMAWQTGEMKTSWIRVLTPDAGKSDNVAKNRGFVFIPEKGDQVLLSFRYNDPNRPFVLGSLFNGKTGKGGSDKNKMKSITTRSGSTITFDDNIEKGKITINDPSGNIITLNGDETITITAPKSITMKSKDIIFEAEKSITLKGDEKVDINSKEIVNTASSKIELNSSADIKVSSKVKEETHTKYNLKASASVDIDGSGTTNIKGGMVNLN